MKYTVNTDNNNYVLALSHVYNDNKCIDNIDIDLADIDMTHLNCYKLQIINSEHGKLVLDNEKLEEEKKKENLIVIKEEIINLKTQLSSTDYKAIKHSEGLISDDEYEPIKLERQALRDKINELENSL